MTLYALLKKLRNILAGAVGSTFLLACCTASCQMSKTRFDITASQVTGAIAEQGFPVDGLAVKLAAVVTSGVASPQLRIQTVSMVNPHEARLRVACSSTAECLPFLVVATGPTTIESVAVADSLKTVIASTTRPTLRVGTPVVLELEQGRIHIKLQVICLESGEAGKKIRVTTKDRKQSYVAEIVNPTLLKGSL